MLKKILIIKTGDTFPFIRKEYGDFEDHVLRQMGLAAGEVLIASVHKGEKLPGLKEVSSIVISGSHSMVTEQEKWSVDLAQWLRNVREMPIPILGICYGHQLIADAFGGVVGYHPEGEEVGNIDIFLTEEGKKDSLLGILPEQFQGYATHAQTVLKLPPGAKLLAKNDFEPHHAFLVGDHIWGVQFHPEFNRGITCSYIEAQREELSQRGKDVDALLHQVAEHDYGRRLFHQFLRMME